MKARNLTTFQYSFRLVGVLLLTSACTIGGGKPGGGGDNGSAGGQPICTGQPDSIYKPNQCNDGANSFYDLVPMKEFDAKVPPAQILLRVNVEYNKNPNEQKLVIGINGITANRPDGRKGFDDACTKSPCSASRYIVLNDLTLNGGTDLYSMLVKIRNSKGLLKISLQAPGIKIVSTQLEVTSQDHCQTTTPTPAPPKVSIGTVVPAGAVTNSTNITINFSSDQAGVTYSCTMDAGAPSTCNSPATYSSLSNGAHTFSVTARNSAGLTSAAATYQWTVDTVPPTVVIQPIASPTNANPVVATFTSNKGITFYCSLDGVTSSVCMSPLSMVNVPEGQHVLSVQAVDGLGNMSDPSTVQWIEDLTPPIAQILTSTPSDTISNVRSRTMTFTANESSTYRCTLDGGASMACTSPYTANNLSEGSHIFSVQATDAAGNVGLATSTSWTNDYTPPTIQLGQVVPTAGLTNASNYSVEFSTNEPSTIFCSMDGAAAAVCNSPYTGAFGQDGAHQLSLYAVDTAGNKSSPISVDWTVDRTAGVLSWSSITPAGSAIHSPDIELVVSSSKPESLTAAVNGQSVAISNATLSLNGLAEGAYTVSVNGTDAAGNPANTLSYQFVVDLTPPQITLASSIDNSGPVQNTSNTFTMTSSEAVTYQCQLDGAGFSTCTTPDELDGLIDGQHEFDVKGIDLAGNESTVASYSWTVDTTAPVTTASFTQTSYGDFTFTFTTDEQVKESDCSLDGATDIVCTSPYSVKNLTPGTHVMRIHSVDLAGNIETQGALLTVVATEPPVPADTVLVPPNYTVTNQTNVTFQFSSHAPQATFVCSVDGAKASACVPPLTLTGLKDGAHTFSVQAINNAGQPDASGGKSFAWTIDTVAPTVTVTSAVDPTKPTTQKSNTLTIAVSETASLQCQLDNGAWINCVSPINYSNLADGLHTFNTKATDAAGNVSSIASVSWSIDTTPPTTTATVDTSNSTEGVLTFNFSANESVAAFFCSFDGAPASACTSPMTVSNVAFGTHTFNVHAIDTLGNVESPGPTLTVNVAAPSANTILVSPNYQYTMDRSISFSFSSNAPNATFVCAFNSSNFTPCTSPVNYSGLSDGSYTFSVKAVNVTGQPDPSGGKSFTWVVDNVAPSVISSSTVPSGSSITVSWTTNEPSTGQISYGVGFTMNQLTAETTVAQTSNSITVTGLQPGTLYTMQVMGHDRAGNAYTGNQFSVKTRN